MGYKNWDKVVLRLSDSERETLKLVVAALKVSEYTDDVDGVNMYGRTRKIESAINEVFTTIIGLSHIADSLPREVLTKLANGTFKLIDIIPTIGHAFEVVRRFKRLNPEKIRTEYGKLTMLLQDLGSHNFRHGYYFDKIAIPVKTVGSVLGAIGAEDLLMEKEAVMIATTPLPPRPSTEQQERKANARAALVDKYGGTKDETKRELIDRCLKSIDDVASFTLINVRPINLLLRWLEDEFKSSDKSFTNLAIRNGSQGSCLTHSHVQQYGYVREALSLWKEIHQNIFEFWETVEEDMLLSGRAYQYRNTGQGFHRVCSGPSTHARMMSAISETHRKMGQWVGSKVVHLGDDDVPNPLVFIDKYTCIPNLLAPIVQTIENLDRMFDDEAEPYPGIRALLLLPGAKAHVDVRQLILGDFYRHGFDGSGDDGGSCIDGRLTSAWNWTSLVHKKPYYSVFTLTGFTGFDANFGG